ncbi:MULTISPECIES: hypothetical protein, partial [Sinorhizobium]|uniref:hypothetical protein n=1 Tax=Sinorhizobium TaxID=28105 RepID=UPI001AECBE6A
DIEMAVKGCLAADLRGMLDDHVISSTWDAPSPATRRASRATLPKIDSSGCLVELVCNGRASLLLALHRLENI